MIEFYELSNGDYKQVGTLKDGEFGDNTDESVKRIVDELKPDEQIVRRHSGPAFIAVEA